MGSRRGGHPPDRDSLRWRVLADVRWLEEDVGLEGSPRRVVRQVQHPGERVNLDVFWPCLVIKQKQNRLTGVWWWLDWFCVRQHALLCLSSIPTFCSLRCHDVFFWGGGGEGMSCFFPLSFSLRFVSPLCTLAILVYHYVWQLTLLYPFSGGYWCSPLRNVFVAYLACIMCGAAGISLYLNEGM